MSLSQRVIPLLALAGFASMACALGTLGSALADSLPEPRQPLPAGGAGP